MARAVPLRLVGAKVHHRSPGTTAGLSNVDNGVSMCRRHHGKQVHDGLPDDQRWRIILDPHHGDVTVSRPAGEPYQLAPTQPYRPTTPDNSGTQYRAAPATNLVHRERRGEVDLIRAHRGRHEHLDTLLRFAARWRPPCHPANGQ